MSGHLLKPALINPSGKREYHGAGWIVVDSDMVIENGCIEVENGVIQSVHTTLPKEKIIDHGPGVIMPPLVNTHLHLELSALKNALPFDKGFRFWVQALLEKREALGEKTLIEEAKQAIGSLTESGTFYVGDISTLNITGVLLENSDLQGICFHEFLGTQAEDFLIKNKEGVAFSLAGHAPHTTSPELLKMLKEQTRQAGLPFSIHVAESMDESVFINEKKGSWADFLTVRGIDWLSWNVGGKTPVEYMNDMGLLDESTIAVHLLNVTSKDIDIIARSKAKVCLCPRSNFNLHKKLPKIECMIAHGIDPALGTDSLASCNTLSMFDEMAFVKKSYPDLDCRTVFSMGTINGSRALGLERITGTLSPGKNARALYLPIHAKNTKDLFREMVFYE